MKRSLLFIFALIAIIVNIAYAQEEPKDVDCEVCLGVVDKFALKLKELPNKKFETIEDMFRKECKGFTHPREKRLCWYIGGSPDSATNILREVSRPLSIGVPSTSICNRLKNKDTAICGLRYSGSSVTEDLPPPKPKAPRINWDKIKTLKMKQIKKHLSDFGGSCENCVEKNDFVNALLKFKPKEDL